MARAFNGTNQKLERTSFLSGFPFSVSGWVYATETTTDVILWSLHQSGSSNYIYGGLAGSSSGDPAVTDFYPNSGSGRAATSTGYTANSWHHILSVCTSASSWTTYLNGAGAGTSSASYTGTFGNMSAFAVAYLNAFSLNIYDAINAAEIAVYNVALTAANAASLADGIMPDQVRPDALVAYYPLGGLWGDTDDDRWSGAYDLTPHNSPTWAAHPRTIYGDEPQVIIPGTSAPVATPWLYARGWSRVIGGGVS